MLQLVSTMPMYPFPMESELDVPSGLRKSQPSQSESSLNTDDMECLLGVLVT